MTSQACLSLALLAAVASACGGPLKTGTISRPDASPGEAACPNDYTLCGIGPPATCANLQEDPEHCGGCGRACAPGVACAAGVCQRVVCQGQPMLSGSPLTGTLGTSRRGIDNARLADINGDGRLDLLTWPFPRSASDTRLQVSLGKIGGGFGPAEGYEAGNGIMQMVVTDINQDGADDLFLSLLTPWDSSQRRTARLELWLGNTDGSLTPTPATPAETSNNPLVAADVSGDGRPDLVAFSAEGGALEVYLSDSSGAFHLSGTYPARSGNLLVKDWNGDGFPDLVLPDSSLQFLINRGDGTFDETVDCGLALGTGVVVSDFNHDGRMDLAGNVGVMLGMGGCRFAPAASCQTSQGCRLRKAADMDSDGQLDLLCLSSDCLLTVLIGNADGSFQAQGPMALATAQGACSILVGDVTGDQRPDLVVRGEDGSMGIWENTCP